MKAFRKMFAILMTLAIVLSMATVAFADGDTQYTITAPSNDHTYEAYQIFTGRLEDHVLSDIKWGSGVDTEKTGFPYGSAEDVAALLTKEDNDPDKLDVKDFAAAIGDYLKNPAATIDTTKANTAQVDAGYYLIKDQDGSVPETDKDGNPYADAYTRFIIEVIDDVTITPKASVPEVDKEIVDDASDNDEANTADIGDTVSYKITGTMPSTIADYKTYYYEFHDTMSKGLTYAGNLKVMIGATDVTEYFTATPSAATTGETTLSIKINDIKGITVDGQPVAITSATTVVVTYDAIVNEQAEIGQKGNTNDVYLEFSNDPNYKGEPGGEDEPHGKTPKDTVVTFTTKIVLTKVDGADSETTLTGAKFKIEGISSNVRVINEQMYVKKTFAEDSTETKYYRLKNGTYSDTAPTEQTMDSYDGTDTYALIEKVTTSTVDEDFETEGWVNENGQLTFTGLGEGTYTITELVAPAGYNLLKAPITVVVSSNVADITNVSKDSTVEWTANDGAETEAKEYTVTNGIVYLAVENNKGATLPETGGMGTTIFYIVGSLMVVGAGVLLITKKRVQG